MKRGEIYWASLSPPAGSAPGYARPVLVIQADAFNRSRIQTVIVAALTSDERLAAAPGNVRVPARQSGLPRASVVNVSQLLTVDRRSLVERVSTLSGAKMREVDAGIRLVLGLEAAA